MIGPVVIGDSLAVGLRPFMPHTAIVAQVGAPLTVGMRWMPTAAAAPRLGVSLFTNDDPHHTAELGAAVRRSARGRRCVAWATIYRRGLDYRAANRLIVRISRQDPRVEVVPWASVAARYVAADGVHPSPAGYRARARLYRRALACRR